MILGDEIARAAPDISLDQAKSSEAADGIGRTLTRDPVQNASF
jgi:hypothetical protein